jgi:hypothetical protein
MGREIEKDFWTRIGVNSYDKKETPAPAQSGRESVVTTETIY